MTRGVGEDKDPSLARSPLPLQNRGADEGGEKAWTKIDKARTGRVTGLACADSACFCMNTSGGIVGWGRCGPFVAAEPRAISGVRGRATSIAAGAEFVVACTDAGRAYSMGARGPWLGQGGSVAMDEGSMNRVVLPASAIVVGVEAGERHAVLVGVDGRCWSCGDGRFGRLGIGEGAAGVGAGEGCGVPREMGR